MDAGHRYLRELLHAYARPQPRPPLLPAEPGWPELVRLLERHRVLATLAGLVRDTGAPLVPPPAELLRPLRLRSSILLLELNRLADALQRAGLQPVVLKGAALAQSVYPRPSQRYFLDLDILVPVERTEETIDLLCGLGYHATGVRHREFYRLHHFHRILCSNAGIVVEVHWNLARPTDFVRFDVAGIARRSRTLRVGHGEIRVPCDADQLLHAAAQGMREGFSDLRRVIDAALLLRAGVAADAELGGRARSQGLATALWTLLRLTRELAGVAVPPPLERELRPPTFARVCLERLDLPRKTLALYSRRRTGFAHLVRWLCAPRLGAAFHEMVRFVAPTAGQMLELGYDPQHLPGAPRRVLLLLRRTLTLCKLLAYQAFRLVVPG